MCCRLHRGARPEPWKGGGRGKAGFYREKNRAEPRGSSLHKGKHLLPLGKGNEERGDSDVCAGRVAPALACRPQCRLRARGGSVTDRIKASLGPCLWPLPPIGAPQTRGEGGVCAQGSPRAGCVLPARPQHPSAAPTQRPRGPSAWTLLPLPSPAGPEVGPEPPALASSCVSCPLSIHPVPRSPPGTHRTWWVWPPCLLAPGTPLPVVRAHAPCQWVL